MAKAKAAKTPDECLEHFMAVGIVPLKNNHARKVVLDTIRLVKTNETLRCAAIARYVCSPSKVPAEEILRTGGLEVKP